VQDRVLQAISAGDPDLAESIARAGLAQYVIWVRQHTAAAIHMGRKFYESIVDVDALALESLIDTMIRALEFAQKADLILPQLQRLRGSISVPRLATRIGAISARWLFRSGHQEEAVLELDCLGPPNQLSDTRLCQTVLQGSNGFPVVSSFFRDKLHLFGIVHFEFVLVGHTRGHFRRPRC
jgi:hypothetical protein